MTKNLTNQRDSIYKRSSFNRSHATTAHAKNKAMNQSTTSVARNRDSVSNNQDSQTTLELQSEKQIALDQSNFVRQSQQIGSSKTVEALKALLNLNERDDKLQEYQIIQLAATENGAIKADDESKTG